MRAGAPTFARILRNDISELLARCLYAPGLRWRFPAVVAVLSVGCAVVGLFFWPATYVATNRVVLETGLVAPPAAAEWIATRVEILRSARVAQRVARDLDLGILSGPLSGVDREQVASELISSLSVSSAGGSGLISIRYRNSNPQFAAQVANAFVVAYEEVEQEMHRAATDALIDRSRREVSALRDEVERTGSLVRTLEQAEVRTSVPALEAAARVARFAPEMTWSSIGQDGGPQSVLGQPGAADSADSAMIAAGESQARTQAVRREFQMAQQSLTAAQARMSQLTAEMAGPPTLKVLESADAGRAERAWPGDAWLLMMAAGASALLSWLLRAVAQKWAPRVHDAGALAAALGLPVFGALVDPTPRVRAVRLPRPVAWSAVAAVRPAPALQ